MGSWHDLLDVYRKNVVKYMKNLVNMELMLSNVKYMKNVVIMGLIGGCVWLLLG